MKSGNTFGFYRAFLFIVAATMVVVLGSCANPVLGAQGDSSTITSSRSTSLISVAETATVEPIRAGQTISAGTLNIWRDAETLYLEYAIIDPYRISETHTWVGSSLADVPQNRQGIVVPGQFPYIESYSPAIPTTIVQVPISWVDGTTLYIFAHSALEGIDGSVKGETSFAGTDVYDSNRWTYYVVYTLPPFTQEQNRTLSGVAFFDANLNGVRDEDEPGIPGVSISIVRADSSSLPQETVTDSAGAYGFTGLEAVTYTVTAEVLEGFTRTSPGGVDRDASENPEDVDFGYFLDMDWLRAQSADGFTIGFWKTNIDKTIKGTTKGIQLDAATLREYVESLSDFALSPLNPTDLTAASDILSAVGSDPALLLSKQLMGSELNYANGAFLGERELPTYFFLYQGEYMLRHAADFSSEQLLAAKDAYDAYNNTHGGTMEAAYAGL